MSGPYDIIRRYPWNTVRPGKQSKRRTGTNYYLLTLYLRENPPDEDSFRIRDLRDQFGTTYGAMYQAARAYHFDSKFYLARIPIPEDIQGSEQEWEWAIEQIHDDGFYMIQPLAYQSGRWGEPSFRQFEDYDTMHLREAFNRALNRLQDGVDFGLRLDGIDVRRELEYIQSRKRMLEEYRE